MLFFDRNGKEVLAEVVSLPLYCNFGDAFNDLVPIPGISRREVEDLYREHFSDQQQAIHCVLVIGIRLL